MRYFSLFLPKKHRTTRDPPVLRVRATRPATRCARGSAGGLLGCGALCVRGPGRGAFGGGAAVAEVGAVLVALGVDHLAICH